VALQLDLFSGVGAGAGSGGEAGRPAGGGGDGDAAGRDGLRPDLPLPPGLVVIHGTRAAEAALLAALDAAAAAARREPSRLALPVRVVVPSRSLRRHVAARLVRPRPGQAGGGRQAMAGVTVQTLFGLACEVLERAGSPVPRGALLFETLVEREARREAALSRGLDELLDGFLAVAPAVADLLDAGFEPEHAEAVEEALAGDGPAAAGRAAVERARALVRVAARCELRFRELGLGRRSTLLRQAAAVLTGAVAPERALPARAVLLHGFVSASGVAADLLAALLSRFRATLLLDQPPPPGGERAAEAAATARLAERAVAAAVREAPASLVREAPAAAAREVPAVARLEAFTAAGADAEARETARRLRRLLDAGRRSGPDEEAPGGAQGGPQSGGAPSGPEPGGAIRPEAIGVVARDLSLYRLALRRHLARLGVPFSGVGERGGLLPAGRRAAAALDLLRWGVEAPADRWLDACEWLPAALRVDLRLAWRALGAARLHEVAALREQAFDGGVALRVRQGLAPAPSQPARAAGGARPAAMAVPPARLPGDGEGGPAGGDGAVVGVGAGDREDAVEPPPPDEDGEGREVARARRISGHRLRRGVLAAARVHDRLLAWPRQAAAAAQLDRLRGLLAELGLDGDPAQPLAAAVSELQREIPAQLPLGSDELRLLLARALGDAGQCPLGGLGGGVQVLSVAEARGRTFDHLFLLGLNRDVFPRPWREDPLLPDDLRQVVQRLLPDLPLARDGFDDERHAFAQLLSAAPAVCLSWRVADDDGKLLPASPFVERLGPALDPRPAPPVHFPPASDAHLAARAPVSAGAGDALAGDGGVALAGDAQADGAEDARPADEHAVLAGLHGSRDDLARVLPMAVAQVREELGRAALDLDPAAVAAARLRVLEELDPDLRTAAGRAVAARLGPYFGFTGAEPPRAGSPLYVTHLEALAACPWQLFLGRRLRIERPPDPLGALPGADPLRLGNLVHRVLDRIVEEALAAAGAAPGQRTAPGLAGRGAAGEPAAAVLPAPAPSGTAPPPVAVRWPAAEELERLLAEAAAAVLAEEGLVLPGLARALASHARPFVEAAGELDWPAPGATVPVVASEVDGELLLEPGGGGPPRRLRFRADREDLAFGRRRFTDYKTGKPLSAARSAEQRRLQLLGEIRSGKRLQAVAYLAAAAGQPALGRYLFLRPDLAPAAREVAVADGDAEAVAGFAAASRVLLAAWDAGSFFPRLVDPEGRREPARCAFCTVAEACLRGDPGARRRLQDWAAGARGGAPPEDPAEAALLTVWDLPLAAGGAAAEAEAAAGTPEPGGDPA